MIRATPCSPVPLDDTTDERRVPHWLWPWCAYVFLLGSESWLNQIKADLALLLFGLVAATALALAPRPRRLAGGKELALAALVVTGNLSFFFSVDRSLTALGLLRIWFDAATYLLATQTVLSGKEVRFTLKAWAYGGAFAALNVVVSAMTGHIEISSLRPTAALLGAQTDPNFVVAELLMPLAAALQMASDRQLGTRVWGGAIAVLIAAAALLTQSRGGVLGMLAVAFMHLVLRGRARMAVVAGVALLAIYLAIAPQLGRFDLQRDPTGADRTVIWKAEITAGIRRWPTGIGLHASQAISPTLPGLNIARDPHSTFVEAFVETGLGGLLAFLWTCGVHLCFRRRGAAQRALIAGLMGTLVAGIFLHVLINQFLWAIWASSAQADPRPRRQA